MVPNRLMTSDLITLSRDKLKQSQSNFYEGCTHQTWWKSISEWNTAIPTCNFMQSSDHAIFKCLLVQQKNHNHKPATNKLGGNVYQNDKASLSHVKWPNYAKVVMLQPFDKRHPSVHDTWSLIMLYHRKCREFHHSIYKSLEGSNLKDKKKTNCLYLLV